MERFRRILVALDLGPAANRLTEGSRLALMRALWIANRIGAKLTLFHSEAPDEYWDPATGGFVPSSGEGRERRALLDAALARVTDAGVEGHVVVDSDSAWLAIIREVLRDGIDAVVAAKRTDAASDGRKLGSVSRKLLRNCPCAVWLEDPREAGDPSVILGATDLSAVGDRATELAASVAGALKAQLHIVHATSLPLAVQLDSTEERDAYERRTREAAVAHIERVLEGAPLAGAAKLHVGLTSPTHAILDGAEKLGAGLVVMGTVSRGGIPGLVVGNSAERLFDRLDCALLTVKPHDFVCPVTFD